MTQGEPSDAEPTFLDEAVDSDLDEHSYRQEQANSQPSKLRLLYIDEWDEEKTYDKESPSSIYYSIE